MSDIAYSIEEISLADCLPLRQAYLWPSLAEEECITDGDKNATHFGVFVDGKLSGCASFHHLEDHKKRIRRVAVSPEYRGKGLGSALLKFAMEKLVTPDLSEIWLNARLPAQNFYRRLGFEAVGACFFERDVEEIRMVKNYPVG
ncbi:MAG: GNAT family N-acetyltransferase [Zymomonas mobilis]|uniref:Putative GNAT family N-acyltransferase n=1 Tax=Zymomonas mobilis TaxID=542 RepID=A0A542W0C5_ZYMMB|nr:GNAT family N-acetyltransferase [Zymomonas mobilis]TQL16983.1 putative GNAT family N-acyltransferase [Zymomonas mobilis]